MGCEIFCSREFEMVRGIRRGVYITPLSEFMSRCISRGLVPEMGSFLSTRSSLSCGMVFDW